MNNRMRAEMLIERMNVLTLNKRQVEVSWNTPGAYMLESHQPGERRIYQIARNSRDGAGGQSTLYSGSAPEVVNYLRAMLEGMEIAKECGYGS